MFCQWEHIDFYVAGWDQGMGSVWETWDLLGKCMEKDSRLNKRLFKYLFFSDMYFLLKGRDHLAKSSNSAGSIPALHTSD